ncbi:MAG: lytic transglycosylase domain-containing protein [Verrucomicrobiae bacterium]|nr:lytic transglycosylase domain-containing protein [Verrucomicrobiae bacterium]
MSLSVPSRRRRFLIALLWLAAVPAGRAQWQEWLETGRRWLEGQGDPDLTRALRSLDMTALEPALRDAFTRLQGEYVLDLEALEGTARTVLPLLESHPDTRPYAAWLRSRVDYGEVARWLREAVRVPAPPVPGPVPRPPPVPTPSQGRRAWERSMERRPAPKGANVWVPRLKPVFRRSGLPEAWVWLAEIESSFDPAARSPVGAVGLYQLMPRTAEGLGLRLQPRDERLDPDKNARAAATYLRQMHGQFKDWHLALAAYNAGPGRVSTLLKSRRAASYDAIAPSLPAETQMYVPKFEAVLKRREGLSLGALRPPSP